MNREKIINIISARIVQSLSVFGTIIVGILIVAYAETRQMVSNRVFKILNSPVLFVSILGQYSGQFLK